MSRLSWMPLRARSRCSSCEGCIRSLAVVLDELLRRIIVGPVEIHEQVRPHGLADLSEVEVERLGAFLDGDALAFLKDRPDLDGVGDRGCGRHASFLVPAVVLEVVGELLSVREDHHAAPAWAAAGACGLSMPIRTPTRR